MLKKAVEEFRGLADEPVRVVSHIDCDGLCAGSLFISFLKEEGKKFVFSTLKQLDEENIKILSREPYSVYVFTDLGSGSLKLLQEYLSDKKVFIFDHHIPEDVENDFVHVNPIVNGLNEDICGSGVTYLFMREFDERYKKLAYLAVVGAVGDIQEFSGMQGHILGDAVSSKKIDKKRGLRLFGVQTKPLSKVLQYSTDPYIPGVSGDEEGVSRFLLDMDIPSEINNRKTRFIDLDDNQIKRLTAAIVMRRVGEDNPEDIVGDLYLLNDEEEGSVIKDVREFSTLLNCCGRMGFPSIGVGVCLNDGNKRREAVELLQEYRRELITGLNWIKENKDNLVQGEHFTIIHAKDKIRDTIIGTVMSIFSRSNLSKDAIFIGMAYTRDNMVKISVRVTGFPGIDLKNVLQDIVEERGIVGGHTMACGGLIKKEDEQIFLERAKKVLDKIQDENTEEKRAEEKTKSMV